jgi:electron transfer flavoprotein beta subunit
MRCYDKGGGVKILIAVKRVVDANIKVRVKPDGSDVDIAHAKMSMNPFDEIAVEEGVRLKEAGLAQEIIALSIGPKACEDTLRTAMAMGADRSIHIETDAIIQPLAVAKLLQKMAEIEKPELILLGKQAIDDDANQTGQMAAALLNWPQATFASNIHMHHHHAVVIREIDGGTETLSFPLPAVISVDLHLNEPRYIKLPHIMAAKKKPITTFSPTQLGVDITPHFTVLQVSDPPARKAGTKLNSVAELVDKLKNEAKVL